MAFANSMAAVDHVVYVGGAPGVVFGYDLRTLKYSHWFKTPNDATSMVFDGEALLVGVYLSLDHDAYFELTLNPAAAPLQNSIGVFGADGRATASFVLPPTQVQNGGLTLRHAYATSTRRRVE